MTNELPSPLTALENLLFLSLDTKHFTFCPRCWLLKEWTQPGFFQQPERQPHCLPAGLKTQIFSFEIRRERHVTGSILGVVLAMSKMNFAVKKTSFCYLALRVSSSEVVVGNSHPSGDSSFTWRHHPASLSTGESWAWSPHERKFLVLRAVQAPRELITHFTSEEQPSRLCLPLRGLHMGWVNFYWMDLFLFLKLPVLPLD